MTWSSAPSRSSASSGSRSPRPSDVGILLAALAVGAGVGLLALSNPLLALLLVFVSSFLRTAQKEFVSMEALTPAFYAMVLALALAVAQRSKQMPRLGVIEWLMTVYVVWNVLSMWLPHEYEAIDPVTGASVDVWRWIFSGVLLPIVVYIVAKSVLDDERSVRYLLWTTVAMGAYSAWVSILQFHGPKSLVWPSYIVDSPNWKGRANGVFNQPVVNGMILVIAFVVCLFLASRPDTKKWMRWGLWASPAILAYSVYLTHTRAALLALVVVVGLGIVFAAGWRRAFVVSGLLGLAAVGANASTFFSSDRSAGGVGSSNEVYDRLNIMATSHAGDRRAPVRRASASAASRSTTPTSTSRGRRRSTGTAGSASSRTRTSWGSAPSSASRACCMWLAILVDDRSGRCGGRMHELPRDTFLGAPLALVGGMAMTILVVNGITVDLRVLDFASMIPFLLRGHGRGPARPLPRRPVHRPPGRGRRRDCPAG